MSHPHPPSENPPRRASLAEAQAVLDFWLGSDLGNSWPTKEITDRWFGGGAALDQQIDKQFGGLVRAALTDQLQAWELEPMDRLALVILLDQFTRNIFRGTARAFAGDGRAQGLVLGALDQGWDAQLPLVARVFMYMPLMHAEQASLQRECIARFEQLIAIAPEALKAKFQSNLAYAHEHLALINRFSRFPYRNAALGRTSTPAEQEFLRDGSRFGQ